MNKLREFTKNDWNGWAGATNFEDGSSPLIYEAENFTMIVDFEGISIYSDPEENNGEDEWFLLNTELLSKVLTLTKEQLITVAEAMLQNN